MPNSTAQQMQSMLQILQFVILPHLPLQPKIKSDRLSYFQAT